MRHARWLLVLSLAAPHALAQNLVTNGDFGLTFAATSPAWTVFPSGNFTASWDQFFGNAAAGSAQVFWTNAGSSATAYFLVQCVPAAPNTPYDVQASMYYPSSASVAPRGQVLLYPSSNAGCTSSIEGDGFGLIPSGADAWSTTTFHGGGVTPPGTVAIKVYLEMYALSPGTTNAWFDDVTVGCVQPDSTNPFVASPADVTVTQSDCQ